MLESKLDAIDFKILSLLLANGRISFADLGRQVNLSLPAAAERVRRLEENGVIEGYQAKLNYKKLGFGIVVFVHLTIGSHLYQETIRRMEQIPEVVEAHHVAGELSFLLKLRLKDLADLEPILGEISRRGQSSSVIVLSTAIEREGLGLIEK